MFIPSLLTILNKQTSSTSEFKKNTFPYLDILYNFALRMTGNENKAGKLVRETFLRAFRFFSHLDEETDYKPWLFRVIKNVYEDIYEKLPVAEEEIGQDLYKKTRDRDINDLQIEKGAFNSIPQYKIVEAVSSLPTDLRIIIILTDIVNFTDEEIVYFTDVPPEVVKMRLYKAREIVFRKIIGTEKETKTFREPDIQPLIRSLISSKLKTEPTPPHIRKKIVKKLS